MAKAGSDAQRWRQAGAGSDYVRSNLKRFLSISVALLALLAGPAWAAKWDVVPTLSIGETYTDNLSLTPDALKQSDWVTQVTPGISIAATGARLKFNASYTPQITYYAQGQQGNQIYQQLTATGNAELAEKRLFVDASANVSQQNVSLQGPLTTSNVNTTGNRATVGTYFVSPYLRRDFGADVQAEARYAYSVVNSNHPSALSNSVGDLVNLRLGSGPAYKLLAWNLDYFRGNVGYDSQPDTSAEVILASARRLITPTVGLLAQVGYENYETAVVGPAIGGRRWSTGFDWAPSPRTHLAATVGERFFGNAYFLDFSHRTRLTTWCAGYVQRVSSARAEFLVPGAGGTAGYLNQSTSSKFFDPVPCENAVQSAIAQTGLPPLVAPVNFFSSNLFLVKRFQALAAIQGVRNVLTFNVFNESREASAGNVVPSGAGNFAVSNTIIQTGTSLLWTWRMTAQNTWNLGGAYSRNDYPDISRIDNITYVGMGLTRQFQPRLSGSLNYRRQQNDSNQSASSYTENAVLAKLQMRF